ncbi:transcriptional regulator [Pseudomonas multiresinivorans]|uniref:Transcriptional regulator n=1 Tax=Pseudomonas multiresinivorans TaxID=95301 RepID=A0A7Z3GNX8_9PSED|nr:transcriptional regulator [Pseudomonas multiresinivorans]QJP07171.1 transcriptional regulator [Pseudomonas multiresinivorans]
MRLHSALAFCAALSTGLALPLAVHAEDTPSSSQVMEQHKQAINNRIADIDYKRKRIVEANMKLTPQETEKFWPIYNSYRTEADKLSKQTLAIIIDYANSYNTGSVSNDDAAKLQKQVLELQDDRQELKEKYLKRIAKEVSPQRALRFLQVEDQLDAMALLEVSREIPLAE